MQRTANVRRRRQKVEPTLANLQNIETRAASAHRELQEAHHFQYVIPNHDGEDSENWDAFYHVLGDARVALLAFVSLLGGKPLSGIEHWEKDLVP